jgi:hypothetical protein
MRKRFSLIRDLPRRGNLVENGHVHPILAGRRKRQLEAEAVVAAAQMLDEYAEGLVTEALEPQFFPELAKVNRAISQAIVKKFEAEALKGLPGASLAGTMDRARGLEKRLGGPARTWP